MSRSSPRLALLPRALLFTPVLFMQPMLLTAQTDPLYETWRWVEFTRASGLPATIVEDVVETSEGVPWV